MPLLFNLLNLFFQLLIIVLLIRYFVEPYRYYGFGPILVSVITLTESFLRPIRQLAPKYALRIQDSMPLFAIFLLLIIRGWFLWILGGGYGVPFTSLQMFGSRIPLINAMAISFTMGVVLIAQMLIAFLFASMMVSHRGVMICGTNAGYACFRDRTFTLFNYARRLVDTNNLKILFIISTFFLLMFASLLAVLTSLSFLYGILEVQYTMIETFFEICTGLITIYWFILLLAILSSWIGADQFSTMVQLVRAMADPYLEIFRRMFPWMRIDFIDLSPIFAFLVLNPGIVWILGYIRILLLSGIMPEEAFSMPAA